MMRRVTVSMSIACTIPRSLRVEVSSTQLPTSSTGRGQLSINIWDPVARQLYTLRSPSLRPMWVSRSGRVARGDAQSVKSLETKTEGIRMARGDNDDVQKRNKAILNGMDMSKPIDVPRSLKGRDHSLKCKEGSGNIQSNFISEKVTHLLHTGSKGVAV